jgi:hypothetical protein
MTDARLRELYQHALATRDGGRERCASPEAMLALARREGTEEERLATLDHVMSCDACRRELDLLRAIEMAGARTTGAPGAAHSRDRPAAAVVVPWKRVVPLALAASLLLAVGVGVRDRFGARDRGPDVVRGAGDDGGGELTLLAPAAGASVAAGAPVVFAWRPDPDARRYVVEVLDADGRAVVSDTTADTTFALRDPSSRLTAGAEYRWWVRTVGATAGAQRASAARPLAVRGQR